VRLHRVRSCNHALGRLTTYSRKRLRQVEGIGIGKTPEEVKAEGTPDWLVPHRVFEGNRPSSTILAERLTPEVLGKWSRFMNIVSSPAVIWNIDSFDQWGVELGKMLANDNFPN